MTSLEPFVSRSELGWPKTPAAVTNTNLGMIAHYDSSKWLTNRRKVLGTKRAHEACTEYWNRVRTQHKSQGWLDIGYAYFACPDGVLFAGRENDHQQAAELPTPGKLQNGNSRYISCTFGLGVGEKPTAKALEAWYRLRRWYMTDKGGRSAVYGHRDFTATDCPGDAIYSLVKDGTLKKSGSLPVPPKPEPEPSKDDNMIYSALGASVVGATTVQPNTWTDISFDTEYGENPDHSGKQATILIGNQTVYALQFTADVEGVTAAPPLGPVIAFEVDAVEYELVPASGSTPAKDVLKESGMPTPQTLPATFGIHHSAVGYLQKGRKLRIRVRHNAPHAVKIVSAGIHLAYTE